MNEQLAQLQILSLIQKKEDCQEVIKQLLKILNDKIKTVNDVLRANLGQPNPQSANPVQSQSGESSNPSSANLVQSQLGDSGQSSNPSSATLVRPQSGELRPSSIPSSATLVRPTDLQNRFADSARLVSDPSLRFQSAVQNQMQNFGPRKMQGGSNDDIYMKKYLKYKNKYLSLKNRI